MFNERRAEHKNAPFLLVWSLYRAPGTSLFCFAGKLDVKYCFEVEKRRTEHPNKMRDLYILHDAVYKKVMKHSTGN